MNRVNIEVIHTRNIDIHGDFGSDSEDDDWERKHMKK